MLSLTKQESNNGPQLPDPRQQVPPMRAAALAGAQLARVARARGYAMTIHAEHGRDFTDLPTQSGASAAA